MPGPLNAPGRIVRFSFATVMVLLIAISMIMLIPRTEERIDPPPDPPRQENEQDSKLLELQDISQLGTLSTKDALCYEPDPAVVAATQAAIRPVQRALQALDLAETVETGEPIAISIAARAPNGLAAYAARTRLTEIALRQRAMDLAVSMTAALIDPSGLPEALPGCLQADALYLRGRVLEARGNRKEALAVYLVAAKGSHTHIPVLLRVAEAGLRAPSGSLLSAAGIDALLALMPLADARIFASDLIARLPERDCADSACLYLRTILYHWMNLTTAARPALDRLETFCAEQKCPDGIIVAAKELRRTLEEHAVADRLSKDPEP